MITTHRVIHPTHYNTHPSGIECWDVIGRLPCHTSNAIKYLWRAGMKHDALCPIYIDTLINLPRGGYEAADFRRIHDQRTPCNHCHAQDMAKAANYLRAEADRLRVEQALYSYRMAVHDARPLLRQVATASAPDPRYGELCLVIGAVLMGTSEALIEAADMLGPPP